MVENDPNWVHDLVVSRIESPVEIIKRFSIQGQFEIDWSPDGSSLAVMTHSGDLMVVPLTGNEKTLASDASGLWTPEWSPRGDWIAYSCKVLPESDHYKDVCLISPDGQQKMTPSGLIFGPTPFIPTAEGQSAPFWNSDGNLLFQRDHFGLITLNVDNMSVDRILSGGGAIYGFAAEPYSLLFRCVTTTIPCGTDDVLMVNIETGEIDPVVRVRGVQVGVVPTSLNLLISVRPVLNPATVIPPNSP